MRKIYAFSLTILCLCVMLFSCGREAVRITREEAMPIQTAIDGILAKDASKYRSAFPPDFDAAIAGEEAMWKYENSMEYSDFDSYLKDRFTRALGADIGNYGNDIGLEFIVDSVEPINTADYPSYFEKYNDYYVYNYTLDVASVEKAVKVSGKLNIWGDDGENSSKAEFVMIKVNGLWFLHPVYYYTTFY